MRWYLVICLVLLLSSFLVVAEENITEELNVTEEPIIEEEVVEEEIIEESVEEQPVEDLEVEVREPKDRDFEASGEEEKLFNGVSYLFIIGGSLLGGLLGFGIFYFFAVYRKKNPEKMEEKKTKNMERLSKLKQIMGNSNKESKTESNMEVKVREKLIKGEIQEEGKRTSLKDIKEELEEIKEEIKQDAPGNLKEDVRKVLRITDDLLGKMEGSKLDAFVNSQDFDLYKKIMKKVYDPVKEDTELVNKLEKVMALFERKVVDKDEARKMLGLAEKKKEELPKKIVKMDKKQVLSELKEKRDGD
jgi:hypothetical protein